MAKEIRLRRAMLADMHPIFVLSNEVVVRQHSINSEPIQWEDHQRWFLGKIADTDCEFYVAETPEGCFVGQVRIEKRDVNIISISVSKEFRGKGFAVPILEKASSASRFSPITAYVKKENEASLKSFEHAGYRCTGEITSGTHICLVLTYE